MPAMRFFRPAFRFLASAVFQCLKFLGWFIYLFGLSIYGCHSCFHRAVCGSKVARCAGACRAVERPLAALRIRRAGLRRASSVKSRRLFRTALLSGHRLGAARSKPGHGLRTGPFRAGPHHLCKAVLLRGRVLHRAGHRRHRGFRHGLPRRSTPRSSCRMRGRRRQRTRR
jgi:hypothetical protein